MNKKAHFNQRTLFYQKVAWSFLNFKIAPVSLFWQTALKRCR